MSKNINFQSLLEFFCLVFFSILMLYLLISGLYLSYVTPKMAPYLLFCALVMMAWAVSKLPEMFRRQYKLRFAHCLILIIPMLFIVLPHNSVGTSGFSSLKFESGAAGGTGNGAPVSSTSNKTSAGQSVSASPQSSQSKAAAVSPVPSATPSAAPVNGEGGAGGVDLIKRYNLKVEADGSIIVSHEKYYQWLTEIFNNMQKYDGVKISIMGFVFKEPQTMGKNEFVPARLLMSCCAADLVPCGIICIYDKTPDLKDGSWVTVSGTIHIGEYQGRKEPQISVSSVTSAEKPQKEYVYPVY